MTRSRLYKRVDHAWTAEDSRLSRKEGWDLFTKDEGVLDIQKLDEMGSLEGDAEAVAFVVVNAMGGSARHARALYLAGRRADSRVFLDGDLCPRRGAKAR